MNLLDWVVCRRRAVFAVWWAHVWLVHYLVLGFMGWDGFGYRTIPAVELLKHGGFGADRFADWSLVGMTPFLELIHAPFLALFGMRGLLIGFPLVLFPLCVAAVFACVRVLTGDDRAATCGAAAYCAMPMINEQPFTAYIDFAVVGLLAWFVWALLRMRAPSRGRMAALAAATCAFSLARAQGLYVAVLFGSLLVFALHRRERRTLWLAAASIAVGCMPAIALQLYKWSVYGSPIAPGRLEILGLVIGKGASMADYWRYAGLPDGRLPTLLVSAVHGWLFHPLWPIGGFYASGSMGTGLICPLALALLPSSWRRLSREERWVIAAGLVVSLLSRDFALPRYSYTTVLSLSLVLGRALTTVAAQPRRWLGWLVLAVVALHALRPEVDLVQLRSGFISPRMNAGRSPWYARGGNVFVFPDGGYRFVIIDNMKLPLPIYGARLTNAVIASIPSGELGTHCEGLARFGDVLVVDQDNHAASCPRTCAIPQTAGCAAWRITLAP